MIHLVTGSRIRERPRVNYGFILQALDNHDGFPLLSWPFGYVKFEEGLWRIWIGSDGRRILSANVPDLSEVIASIPPSVLLMSREIGDRLLPILREHGIEVIIHHTGRELSTDGL